MVFGGRKAMSSMNGHKSASYERKNTKSTSNGTSKRTSLPSTNEEDHHHAVFFCEDPEFAMYLEDEPDPIVIDFAEELHSHTGHCEFRLASKSLGEHDQLHCCQNIPFAVKVRRAWSEGSLALVPSMHTGCPCEAVQGIHSHQSCPKMDMTIPDTCCFTCGSDWALDHTAWACFECGGFGLARPCGKCNGKCGERWSRDLKSTHASGEASWAGNCSYEKENEASNKTKSESSLINQDSKSH